MAPKNKNSKHNEEQCILIPLTFTDEEMKKKTEKEKHTTNKQT